MKGGTVLALHPAKKLRTGSRTGILVAFTVNDIDVVCKELKYKKVKFFNEPKKEPVGKHTIILDPDGYMISIVESKIKEEEWQQAPRYYGFTSI